VVDEPAEPAVVQPVKASPLSALSRLREIREQAVAKLYKDLKVPRWDEYGAEIWVRYGPLDVTHLNEATQRREKDKKRNPGWVLLANCDGLVKSCIGVYALVEGRKYSLRPGDADGEWTKFDDDLARALGIDATRAVEVVRALYLTDGDIISTIMTLGEWSNTQITEVDEEYLAK